MQRTEVYLFNSAEAVALTDERPSQQTSVLLMSHCDQANRNMQQLAGVCVTVVVWLRECTVFQTGIKDISSLTKEVKHSSCLSSNVHLHTSPSDAFLPFRFPCKKENWTYADLNTSQCDSPSRFGCAVPDVSVVLTVSPSLLTSLAPERCVIVSPLKWETNFGMQIKYHSNTTLVKSCCI